jgi:predicted nucleic acid-binding protein
MEAKMVYLDVCLLSRPFDDQGQARIRLETEALSLILAHIRRSHLTLLISPVHQHEIEAIPEFEERYHLLLLLRQLGLQPNYDPVAVRQRTEILANGGMGIADAAHVAFAESAGADFVTVDDRLIQQCRRLNVQVWCGSPLSYCDKEGL